MTQGCIDEGHRIVALLAKGLVRVGPADGEFAGIAVPRHCAELTPAEEADAQRGLPRTVTLARALLVGLWSLPPEGAAKPSPIAAWTRTLETMSSWVRLATRSVEDTARAGGDQHLPAWHALVLVEAMRAALRATTPTSAGATTVARSPASELEPGAHAGAAEEEVKV